MSSLDLPTDDYKRRQIPLLSGSLAIKETSLGEILKLAISLIIIIAGGVILDQSESPRSVHKLLLRNCSSVYRGSNLIS